MNSIQNSFNRIDPDLGQIKISSEQVSKGGSTEDVGASQGTGSFFQALEKTMEEVNQNQLAADEAIKDVVAGKSKNLHEAMLSLQKADLSLKTMMQVRNKILEAYKEIMRMQV